MYIERALTQQIYKASEYYPVVMVTGQRQVGKSTMLNHIKGPERRYISLDDLSARRLAENDPALFFETYGFPILIDEFQRVPELLLEIKNIVDRRKLAGEDVRGMVWLTGSQRFSMMKGVSESLAGRTAVFEMSSLSQAEKDSRVVDTFNADINVLKNRTPGSCRDVNEVFRQIFTGGMPQPFTTDIDRDRYFMDYVNTYIERDVRGLSGIGKLHEFTDFLVYMASRTGQELKYDDIAKSIGISAPTAKQWISVLEASGIIYILRPYYSNMSKRLVKTPKVYFMDTGLAAYLCRWPNSETLENGPMSGAFFETWVVTEIVKSYMNCGKQVDLYYYRDVDGKEIDLLQISGNKLYPIEIKKAKNPANPDKNLSALEKLGLEVQPEIVLCMSDELIPYNRNVWLCPVMLI